MRRGGNGSQQHAFIPTEYSGIIDEGFNHTQPPLDYRVSLPNATWCKAPEVVGSAQYLTQVLIFVVVLLQDETQLVTVMFYQSATQEDNEGKDKDNASLPQATDGRIFLGVEVFGLSVVSNHRIP